MPEHNLPAHLLRQLFWPAVITCFLLVTSCRYDDAGMHSPELPLHFSHDTVIFDTVFTTVGSVTRQFTVINNNSGAVQIGRIETGLGNNGNFRINVDGVAGPVTNYRLEAGDSMYVFTDVTIDPADKNLPFVVRDSVRFLTGTTEQHVKLMAWGQDANFYRNETLECNGEKIWTAERPYVIIDSVLVPRNCLLRIEAGARIHSHHRSSFLVLGSLEVNGSPENRVVFEGDRLDPFYRDRAGQWAGLRFLAGSNNNIIRYADIKNGLIGIQVDSLPNGSQPNLEMEGVKINNMSLVGLLGYTSHIRAVNSIISNCSERLFLGELGGNYEFYHCTFANSGHRESSVVALNTNFEAPGGPVIVNNLNFTMVNSILWGGRDEELSIIDRGDGNISLIIQNNLIKTGWEELAENENILNKNPKFKDQQGNDFQLQSESPAIGQGSNIGISIDIEGNQRNLQTPDLGAHESQ